MGLFGGGAPDLMAVLGLNTAPFDASLVGVKGKLAGLGNALVTTGAIAAAAFAGVAVKSAMDYETALAEIASAAGDSAPPVDTLRDAIGGLSETAGAGLFTQGQVAAGWKAIAAEGLGTAGTQKVLAEAMRVAGAEGRDLGEVASELEGVLSAWNMTADESARVTHSLKGVQEATGTSTKTLSATMVELGPIAANLGMSFADTAAMAGVLKDKGVESGSAILKAWKEASTSGTEAAALFDRFGVSLRNADGSLRPIPAVLADFDAKTREAGLSTAQTSALLNDAFGAKTAGAMITLSANVGELRGAIEATKNPADLVGQALTKAAESPQGQVAKTKKEFADLALNLGTALLPTLRVLASVITTVLGAFNSLSPGVQNAIMVFGGATLAGTKVIGMLKLLWPALSVGLGPIALIAAAIAALAWAWTNNVGDIQGKTKWLVEAIVKWFGNLKADFDKLVSACKTAWNAITSAFEVARDITVSVLTVLGNAIKSAAQLWDSTIGNAMRAILAFWRATWDTIKAVLAAVFLSIIAIFTGDTARLREIWSAFGNRIREIWTELWERIKSLLRDAWSNIITTLQTNVDKVLSFFRALPGNIVSALGNLGGLLVDAGSQIIDGLVSGIRNAAGRAASAARDAVNGAIQGARNMLGIASPSRVFMDIGENVVKGFQKGVEGMPGFFDKGRLEVALPAVRVEGGLPSAPFGVSATGSTGGGISVVFERGSIVVNGDMEAGMRVASDIERRLRRLGVR